MNSVVRSALVCALMVAGALPAFAERETGGFAADQLVEVRFSSPGNGIDEESHAKFLAVVTGLLQQRVVKSLKQLAVGFEGDVGYCLSLRPGSTLPAYEQIKALIDDGNRRERLPKSSVQLKFTCDLNN